jgi:queuine tRNA-ribosyltransferase
MALSFRLDTSIGPAHAGLLTTPHGQVPTPTFMPVATQGAVKTLSSHDVSGLGASILLGNTYHLYLRPGIDLIERLGGLHPFMAWDGPILTDSGGFQAFSLGALINLTNEGVAFRSHIDGSRHLFTPEKAIEYQQRLGVDIMMCLDQLVPANSDEPALRDAMDRTHQWAARCRQVWNSPNQALFGIVQGGVSPTLREASARFITGLDFPGYAVGGLAVGETKAQMYSTVALMDDLLPKDRPRYLMGVGSPEDLVECVARGMDLFDCALPTRVARNGGLFTPDGRVDILSARYLAVNAPLMESCDCYSCRNFSAAYLHHLFKAKELLGLRLATIHNLRFVLRLMSDMRSHILAGHFNYFARDFLTRYKPTNEAVRLAQKARWLSRRRNED